MSVHNGTNQIQLVDIHEWISEESEADRKIQKAAMKALLITSVKANGGNEGMVGRVLRRGATDPLVHRCNGCYVWYTVDQDPPKPGETAYPDDFKVGWQNRSANWAHLMATAKGSTRGIEVEKMHRILGRDRKSVCKDLEEICQRDLNPFQVALITRSIGLKRPNLGIRSYKIGQCEIQLGDAGSYNDHMRDIHGVDTE